MKVLLFNIVILVSLQKSVAFESEEAHHQTTRILICVDDSTPKQFSLDDFVKLLKIFPTTNIEYEHVSECKEQIKNKDETILAVIAPKPFEEISESEITMYFYDVSYNISEEYENVFPNAVSQVRNWRPLKHAFSHFFRSQNWERIAIISDDTPFSAAFELELVEHLREEGFVYNVQRCYQSHWWKCDFTDALHFIRAHEAFVVVVNIDSANAGSLEEGIKRLRWNWDQFAWLTRDWEAAQALAKVVPLVFSFSLAPTTANLRPELRARVGPHFSSIGQGLSLITGAAQNKFERIDLFYKDIAKRLNVVMNTCKTQAYIQLVSITKPVGLIKVLNVSNCSAVVDYSGNQQFRKVYDLPDCSLYRSGQFLSPCYDVQIILFVFVGCTFIIMMFLLVYFFNRYLVWT